MTDKTENMKDTKTLPAPEPMVGVFAREAIKHGKGEGAIEILAESCGLLPQSVAEKFSRSGKCSITGGVR